MFLDDNPRIAIIGPTGAGKSTLAQQIADLYSVDYVDADRIFHGTPPADRHERLSQILDDERWVSDGNIGRFRDLQLPRVTTLVWLDYSLLTTLPRLFRRTLRRIFTRELVHGVFQETLRKQFMSRDSVFLFAVKRHTTLRLTYEELIGAEDAHHLNVVRLRSPRQTRHWLQELGSDAQQQPE